ncbi:MAG TPA: hypothetical protein VJ925_05700 [Longimicrobiales bacterium]|nr:hypothetical protein [Longimicrobiales bacterium]
MVNPLRLALAASLVTMPLSAQTSTAPVGTLPAATQIELAVQAAPPEMRAEATVQGYDEAGNFVTLREGSNEMVCMAPSPDSEMFEVSCHHIDLEPFFERGRELRAAGIIGQERTQMRWDEVEAGTLPLPYGTMNYILTAEGFDAGTAEIVNPSIRWVIYTPNATPESTGLSAQPTGTAPWLMFSGTPGAHIMITPPRG